MNSLQPLTQKVDHIQWLPYHGDTQDEIFDVIVNEMKIFEWVDENSEKCEYMYLLDDKKELHKMRLTPNAAEQKVLDYKFQPRTSPFYSPEEVFSRLHTLLSIRTDTIPFLSSSTLDKVFVEKHHKRFRPYRFLKCRKGWFSLISSETAKVAHHKLTHEPRELPEHLQKDIQDFDLFAKEYISKKSFEPNHFGTDEALWTWRITFDDIEKWNEILRKVIAYLEATYPDIAHATNAHEALWTWNIAFDGIKKRSEAPSKDIVYSAMNYPATSEKDVYVDKLPFTRKVDHIQWLPFHTGDTQDEIFDVIVNEMKIFEWVDENWEKCEYMYILNDKKELYKMRLLPDELREERYKKWHAVICHSTPENIISLLKSELDEYTYIDFIPHMSTSMLSRRFEHNRSLAHHKFGNYAFFKCRKSWFVGIANMLDYYVPKILSKGTPIQTAMDDFVQYFQETIWEKWYEPLIEGWDDVESGLWRITSDDIEKWNEILRKVIAYLGTVYPDVAEEHI